MKRVATAELLDTDSGTPAEVGRLARRSAADQSLVRRRRHYRRHGRARGARNQAVVPVAAGSCGGIGIRPGNCAPAAAASRVDLQVTLLDRAPSHLSNGHSAVAGDALALPFRDASFDLVSCNLFAHHLSPQELVQFVDEALRVCRVAVLINDLVRHPLHLSLVYAGMPLYRSRLTRHDAPASVRQAYTPEEMQTLLAQTQRGKSGDSSPLPVSHGSDSVEADYNQDVILSEAKDLCI